MIGPLPPGVEDQVERLMILMQKYKVKGLTCDCISIEMQDIKTEPNQNKVPTAEQVVEKLHKNELIIEANKQIDEVSAWLNKPEEA